MPLSQSEYEEYYEGFSNATLWPLYHDTVEKPEFHREWWDAYVSVNRRFAEETAKVAAEGATRSRELAGQWTIERQATEMMSIYEDLIAGRPVPVSENLKPDLGRPRLGGRLH